MDLGYSGLSGLAMGCAGGAMHKSPVVRGPTVESVFWLSE